MLILRHVLGGPEKVCCHTFPIIFIKYIIFRSYTQQSAVIYANRDRTLHVLLHHLFLNFNVRKLPCRLSSSTNPTDWSYWDFNRKLANCPFMHMSSKHVTKTTKHRLGKISSAFLSRWYYFHSVIAARCLRCVRTFVDDFIANLLLNVPGKNKKLSCCCDSRSYCMHQFQYDWLQTHYYMISVLTPFIFIIGASRTVNKNVSTGAIVKATYRVGRS